jgi:hypothetical protein
MFLFVLFVVYRRFFVGLRALFALGRSFSSLSFDVFGPFDQVNVFTEVSGFAHAKFNGTI